MTIVEAQTKLRSGELTALALAEELLAKIATENPKLNAYLEVFSDVREQALAADERLKREGSAAPALTGIPLAIKDNILIEGRRVSSASKMLEGYVASYDATVIKKLKAAGAVFVGRANLDEFAMGSSTENSAFGVTKNPHDLTRVAGGSSGGPAAAVAAGLALGGLGSDTGGSIRQPASFVGVVGLKTTYGAVSRSGLMAMASSLDQIGPFAQTVVDAELMFNTIKGADPLDATSHEAALSPNHESKPLRIGVLSPAEMGAGADFPSLQNFTRAVATLRQLGYEVKEVSLPHLKYALACYYVLQPAEVSTNLARYDGVRYGSYEPGETLFADYAKTRGENFGAEVRRRIMLGTYVLSSGYYDAYYGKAVAVRRLITQDFVNAFKAVDVIAMPTTPDVAFPIGSKTADPLQMYLEDIFTVPANIAGVPALSIPSGPNDQGLPFGLQLIAPHFREDRLFAVGKTFEHAVA